MTMENQAIKNCDTDLKDILEEIPDGELANLRDLFKVDWPSHVHIHNFIDNAISWKQDNDKKHFVTVYSIDGNWKDGTFIALIQIRAYEIIFYSFDKSLPRIRKAFRETQVLQWDKSNIAFPITRLDFVEIIYEVKKDLGPPNRYYIPCHIWWISKEKALQFEWSIPEDYYIDDLQISHTETILAVWPHKEPGSEVYINNLINLNGGIGLFSKHDSEPCAWIMKSFFGGVGFLQVAEKHQRKGYGSLLTRIFSKKIAKEGLDPIACVLQTNTASQVMFTKIGFESVVEVSRICA